MRKSRLSRASKSELEDRQAQLVGAVRGGEGDRQILDREPGRVERRDLVGSSRGPAPLRRAPRRARSRRLGSDDAGVDGVGELAAVARLLPVVAEEREPAPARRSPPRPCPGPSAPISETCWPAPSVPSASSTSWPGVTVTTRSAARAASSEAATSAPSSAADSCGALGVDVPQRDLPAAGEERLRGRAAVDARTDDRGRPRRRRARASRRRAPPPRPCGAP